VDIKRKSLRFLGQKTAATTFNWRFFVLKDRPSITLHRYVFFRQFNGHSLLVRILVSSFLLLRWYCWGAPASCLHAFKHLRPYYKKQLKVPVVRQWITLLRLTYGYCIPGDNYYHMQMWNIKPEQWLDYVYDFQTANWHSAFMDLSDARENQNLLRLRNKYQTEQQLKNANIPSVISLLKLKIGESLTSEDIANLPNEFFCKPNEANQSMGCWHIKTNHEPRQQPSIARSAFVSSDEQGQLECLVRYLTRTIEPSNS
jgi:hypothetical protein